MCLAAAIQWFAQADGWKRGGYQQAIDFCEKRDLGLCAREQICPNGGKGSKPARDFNFDVWVPFKGEFNSWLSSDSKDQWVCSVHHENGWGRPDWGKRPGPHGHVPVVPCCVKSHPQERLVITFDTVRDVSAVRLTVYGTDAKSDNLVLTELAARYGLGTWFLSPPSSNSQVI